MRNALDRAAKWGMAHHGVTITVVGALAGSIAALIAGGVPAVPYGAILGVAAFFFACGR